MNSEIVNQFKDMPLEVMLALNKQLCAAIRAKQSAESAIKITTISEGDFVMVAGNSKSKEFAAKVKKVLRTNVDVISQVDGRVWRVPASMLTKV